MNRNATELVDFQQRAFASLLGMAIGDALGATVEFMTPTEIRQTYGTLTEIRGGGWLHLPAGQVTDDTQMALCIARSVVHYGWSLRDIADRFVAWLHSKPPDVGNTCRRGIRRYMHYGTLTGPPCESDAGNGAVMRMAPVAVASLADVQLLESWATEQARITHHHPLSDAACLHVGRLLHLACTGRSREAMRRYAQNVAAAVPQFGYANYKGLSSAYVVDTVQTVFYHFFRSRNFEECLIQTVNRGGDADTAGAIVGALAGAFYGLEQIPQRWVTALDRRLVDELRDLSVGLLEHSPLAREGHPQGGAPR